MDADLRELERRHVLAPHDRGLRDQLFRARERAGIAVVPEYLRLMGEVDARYRAARAAYVSQAVPAARAFVGGAFASIPHLERLALSWSCERGDEWWLSLLASVQPSWLDERTALAEGLLRFARVIAIAGEESGALTFTREANGIAFDPEAEPATEIDASRLLPFRDLEALQLDEDRRTRHVWVDRGERLAVGGDGEGALAAIARADAELAAARSAFVEAAEPLWEEFVPALFRADPRLDVLAIHGFTPGYNDNWHVEHEQRLYVTEEQLDDAVRELAQRGLDTLGLDAPGKYLEWPRRRELGETLSVFRTFLRERHGSCFVVALRRARDGATIRVGKGFPES